MLELIDGSTAIVRGALAAGCRFFAGYPITPASSILLAMMRELPRHGGVAIQGEDEIASIGMTIGAAMAGLPAMTATSGPGMSLYSENLGLAIMGEVPLVVVDVQRLGPATGGATTVGQGDVQMARWGTSGGYPVIVLAPSSIPECFALTRQAFTLARRFRCPVFLLTDKELALTLGTVETSEVTATPGEGPAVRSPEEDGTDGDGAAPYRYDPPDGVPPLRPFGGDLPVRFTGSTHDEHAFLTKHPPTVGRLNRHLEAKIEAHREEIERVVADLEPGAETLVVAYGVVGGAVREAVREARRRGWKVSALLVQSLWPVPERALRRALDGVRRALVVELNPGLYRREVERLAALAALADRGGGVVTVEGIARVDGELVSPQEILEALP